MAHFEALWLKRCKDDSTIGYDPPKSNYLSITPPNQINNHNICTTVYHTELIIKTRKHLENITQIYLCLNQMQGDFFFFTILLWNEIVVKLL